MIELNVTDLKQNDIYYVQSKSNPKSKQIGNFKTYEIIYINNLPIYYIAEFDKIYEIIKKDGTKGNSGLTCVPPFGKCYRHNKWFTFYEIKKNKILQEKEKNLINNCLKKITGDIYFNWY
jgi:hypothetical protein